MNPVTHQAPLNHPGELTSRLISADTIKMPEPIIEPITSMVALVRPRAFTNSVSCWEWTSQSLGTGGGGCLMSVLRAPPDGWSDRQSPLGIRAVLPVEITPGAFANACGHDFNPESGKIPLLIS